MSTKKAQIKNRLDNGNAKESPPIPKRVAKGQVQVHVVLCGIAPGILFQSKGCMDMDDSKKTKHRPPDVEAKMRGHWIDAKGEWILPPSSDEGPKAVDRFLKQVEKGRLAVPWVMLYNCFCEAGVAFKYQGQKRMGNVMAGTIFNEQAYFPLYDEDGEPAQHKVYVEFCRVPPKTGAMVKLGRPLVYPWYLDLTFGVDDAFYDPAKLEEILIHAGKMVGLGAWRPAKRGPYGKFSVESFEVL